MNWNLLCDARSLLGKRPAVRTASNAGFRWQRQAAAQRQDLSLPVALSAFENPFPSRARILSIMVASKGSVQPDTKSFCRASKPLPQPAATKANGPLKSHEVREACARIFQRML
jgi:hypothetical protein